MLKKVEEKTIGVYENNKNSTNTFLVLINILLQKNKCIIYEMCFKFRLIILKLEHHKIRVPLM